jgi:hypothetical protein
MYVITRKQWNEIKQKNPDYTGKALQRQEHAGKVCEPGEACCFESCIPGAPNTGATLIFQHIHFEIVD